MPGQFTPLIESAVNDVRTDIFLVLTSIAGLGIVIISVQLAWKFLQNLTRTAIDKEFDSFYDDRY